MHESLEELRSPRRVILREGCLARRIKERNERLMRREETHHSRHTAYDAEDVSREGNYRVSMSEDRT